MDAKISSALGKVLALKNRGNFSKAVSKLNDLIAKYPNEAQLYIEAIDMSLEAGESLQACQFFKKAYSVFPGQRDKLWAFTKDRVKSCNDPVLAKTLLELAIRKRDLESGREILKNLENNTASQLLKRTRVKKQTLMSASRGEHAFKGDFIINIFSEALLCLRTGRIKEGAAAFVRILKHKPIENEVLEPFLAQLEKSFPGESSLLYAVGCSYLIAQKYEKALDRFSQCMRTKQTFLDDIIERIESLQAAVKSPPKDAQMTLAEAFFIKGNILKAAELLETTIEENPEISHSVLDLLGKYSVLMQEESILRYIFAEAAILSKQSGRALEQLKKLYEDRREKNQTLDWLEKKFNECFLPPNILMFYGEIALEKQMTDRALEILKAVIEFSSSDLPVVLHLLEKYQSKDAQIENFYREISVTAESPSGYEDMEIEHFEKSEFAFSSQSADDSHWNDDPESSSETDSMFEREASIDEPAAKKGANEKDEHEEASRPALQPQGPQDVPDPSTVVIHVDEEPEAEAPHEGEDDSTSELSSSQDTEDEHQRKTTASAPTIKSEEAPAKLANFESRYQAFLAGELEGKDIFALIEEAFTAGESGKLKELLSFEPDGIEDNARRKLLVARYYLWQDSPIEALSALKTIPLESLQREEKHEVLFKLATCYRQLNMYEAAHAALARIAADRLSGTVIDKLTRQNYSDYLKELSGYIRTIDKAGSLE